MFTCDKTIAKSLATGVHHSDVLMPHSRQVLRGLTPEATIRMLHQGGIVLPRERRDAEATTVVRLSLVNSGSFLPLEDLRTRRIEHLIGEVA